MTILLAAWLILSDQTVWWTQEPVQKPVQSAVNYPLTPFLQEHPYLVGKDISACLYHGKEVQPATWKGVALSQGAVVTFSHASYVQLSTGKLYRSSAQNFIAVGAPVVDIFSTEGHFLLQTDTERLEKVECLGLSSEPLVLDEITAIDGESITLKNKGKSPFSPGLAFVIRSWGVGDQVLVIDRPLPVPTRRGGFTEERLALQRLIIPITSPEKALLTCWL